jgi:hypothetical protein
VGAFGLGDGMNDLGSTPSLAEMNAAEASRPSGRVAEGRWPGGRTTVRFLGVAAVITVVAGCVITLIRS